MFKIILRWCLISHILEGISVRSEGTINNYHDIKKRQINSLPLVYPYGATYKLLIGMAAPVPNEDHISLIFAINFQYQYLQFQNITQLSQYYSYNDVSSREQRDAEMVTRRDERLVFYRSVAEMLEQKGRNGLECVLRAICEAAQYPVQEEAFVGEILHILLTPDYGHSPLEKDGDWAESIAVYRDAAIAGRQMFSCAYIYSGCPEGQGVLELITRLRDE